MNWFQLKYLISDNAFEVYVGLMALLCTTGGVWVATRLSRPRENALEVKDVDLSTREYEVLQLVTQGLSNAEIAEKLCLSLSTVKTHVSTLFVKMEVRSRTQAVEKANRLRITPPGKLIL